MFYSVVDHSIHELGTILIKKIIETFFTNPAIRWQKKVEMDDGICRPD